MACLICSLKDVNLQNDIERRLDINHGYLTEDDKKELKANPKYSQYVDIINKLTPQECEVHWNFHQSSSFAPSSIGSAQVATVDKETTKPTSIRDEIARDEATILYDLMAKQMATFNCLTKKINAALSDGDSDMTCAIVNPVMLEFYKGLTADIRDDVKALRELNQAINGEKSGSLEGLKAIAVALTSPLPGQNQQNAAIAGVQVGAKDLSTNEYDY